jgi:hypothetical protein
MRQMSRLPLPALAFLLGTACPAFAGFQFLDLSQAANRGLEESFDETVPGVTDLREKNGLKDFPVGQREFRGIPFKVLDPAQHQGHSFIALKGRAKPDFPQGVSIPAGGLKATELFFLHTCRWGGTASNVTVAEYDIVYEDGQVAVIPLRVGVELENFWGADDTPTSPLAWWHPLKNAGMGVNLFPWKNPRPTVAIQSILFKSMAKMPVPILFAITASDQEVSLSLESPKPEKTVQTDTQGWFDLSSGSSSIQGTALDMSARLDAPAGKHGAVTVQGDQIFFEDGIPARFWGTRLAGDWESWDKEQMEKAGNELASQGNNLVLVKFSEANDLTGLKNMSSLVEALKSKGIYTCWENTPTPAATVTQTEKPIPNDPAVIPAGLFNFAEGSWAASETVGNNILGFDDSPMVLDPGRSLPFQLAQKRALGNPAVVQWSASWPNEYSAEIPLILSAYSTFEGYQASIGQVFSAFEGATIIGPGSDLENNPLWSIQWPIAALAYIRGDLKEGRLFVEDSGKKTTDDGTTEMLKTLAHRSGLANGKAGYRTDVSGELKAKVQPKLKTLVSDSGQITWQGNVGVVKIEAPRFQALIGFLSHRKFNNTAWSVETPNPFGALSMISLTPQALSFSDHILVTGVTRAENTGMIYNQAKTKIVSLGTGPVLVEPLKAKFVLYRFKKDPKLKVRALDQNGKPLKIQVPYRWVGQNLSFSWVTPAFYLEISKK